MEALLDALRTMLKGRETVDPDSVVVYFIEFGDSALNILIRCYVNLADWGAFTAEKEKVLLEVMRVVDSVDLQIAFPSRSIYIENVGDGGMNLASPATAPAADQPAPPDRAPLLSRKRDKPMQLYFFRHGIAQPGDANTSDFQRELTAEGRQRTQQAADQIKAWDTLLRPDLRQPLDPRAPDGRDPRRDAWHRRAGA